MSMRQPCRYCVICCGRRSVHPLYRASRFQAYHGLLPTRIEEKPMPVSRREFRIKRVSDLPGPQQLDLFGGDRPRVIMATPTWRELPLETRATLTDLMVHPRGDRRYRPGGGRDRACCPLDRRCPQRDTF